MKERGFTLLELLVAIAIFAMLSAVAFSSLGSMVDIREQVIEDMDRLAELQMALTIMERDFTQAMAQRNIRDEYEELQPAMQRHNAGSMDGAVEFTRGGWSNPAGFLRSNLQRVAYRLEEDQLLRLSWLVLDRATESKPYSAVILEKVESFSVKFYNDAGQWQETWPLEESREKPYLLGKLPKAVKIELDIAGWGEIERIFLLPR